MASDYLLEIDGIKGESATESIKGWIDIESFSWGMSNAGTAGAGGGGGAGKVSVQDIHFSKRIDKASPLLMLACATGQHIKKAVLHVRKAGGEQQEYYTVILEDLLVSSYQSSGGPADDGTSTDPADAFSLNFAKLQFQVRSPDPAGGTTGAVTEGSWSRSGRR